MTKRIVLCFDGTWATAADEGLPEEQQLESNVSRFYKSIAGEGEEGYEQLRWYDPGVGTAKIGKWLGGGIGLGLDVNIVQGYKYLAEHYADGDEVYLFGFSRGAYTARSLVGMIDCCGLVYPGHFLDQRAVMANRIYRASGGKDSEEAAAFLLNYAREISIHFLGVWDTVGALGVPADILEKWQERLYGFHDVELADILHNAYHAMALDEHRQKFDVCRWASNTHTVQEQRWFIGSHSDIGGGYEDARLSDITLIWMQDHAAKLGLKLDKVQVQPDNYLAPIHTSSHLASYNRKVLPGEVIDGSIIKKMQDDPSYSPQNEGLQEAIAGSV